MATVSYAGKNIRWNTSKDAKHVATDLDNTKNLKALELEANTLGVEASKVIGDALANHPEFERALWKDLFTGRLKQEIPQALKHLFSGIMRAKAKLKELDLSDNALGPIGVEGMIEFIQSPCCYSLQELRLNNNGLGIKGGTMLAEALIKLTENASKAGTNLNLKVFISGRNRLEKEGAKVFAKFFSLVKSLEEIAMPQNGIFHEGIAALAKSFSLNPHLRIINLNDNTFTPKGAKAMAEELPHMTNLEIINFGDCLLKTAGALSIANALKENHEKLRELHLDSNEIQLEGGLAIIDSIKEKPNIKYLMLDSNQFGGEGAEIIQQEMKKIGKEEVLGSLEDTEEPDDDESESDGENSEGSENEDDSEGEIEDEEEEDEDEDEDDDDAESIKGVSPLKKDFAFQYVKCSAAEFMAAPSANRLFGLANPSLELIEEAKKRAANPNRDPEQGITDSPDALIHEYVQAYMTVASLSISTNQKVIDIVESSTKDLAKELFILAEKFNLVSVATNCFLVHLGLVKSESKKFKIEWDLRGGMMVLAKTVREDFFPSATKRTMQFFFSKPGLRIDAYPQERSVLLANL